MFVTQKMNLEPAIKEAIRDIPDFPKPGIMFKDITPVFYDQKLCSRIAEAFAEKIEGNKQSDLRIQLRFTL